MIDDVVAAVRGILRQEEALPSERDLAQRINVKRHQVRRALEVLRQSNELETPGARRAAATLGKGLVLAQDTNPLEVIELRMALEPSLARLAAVRASPGDIARIERAAVAEEGDSGANDLAFHKAIAAGSRNGLAAALYYLVREIGRDARLKLGSVDRAVAPVCPVRLAQRNAEHRAVAEAIAARDPDAAERAMRAHLAKVHHLILSRLSPDIKVTQ